MSGMITKRTIWTGDTTSHGGTLHDGCKNDTYNNTHRAVLVGHKFWCPQCMCWSKFIEGTPRYSVDGRYRVLEGHRASCGAFAIHRLDIPIICYDLRNKGIMIIYCPKMQKKLHWQTSKAMATIRINSLSAIQEKSHSDMSFSNRTLCWKWVRP